MDGISDILTPQSVKDAQAQQNALLTQQQKLATQEQTQASQKLTNDLTMQYFRRFGSAAGGSSTAAAGAAA